MATRADWIHDSPALTLFRESPSRALTASDRILRSRISVGAILAAGIGLRVWQYSANSSLWVDEAALARNVIDRSVVELFAPLDHGQVAPWGFLLLEKLAVWIFGNNEYVL